MASRAPARGTDGALALLGALALEDGRPWASVAEGFQLDHARAVLTGEPPLHFETRPRGASKTTDEAGIALAWLCELAPLGAQGYVVACDADQAGLLHRELAGFVSRSPAALFVEARLDVQARRVVNRATGATLTVLSADGPSAYGLRPHLVVADELAVWPDTPNTRRLWEALVSALPKTRGARLVVLTTAGDPAHWSHKVLDHARRSPRWRVSEVPGPVPWADPADLEEQRGVLLPSQFARLHLNEWTAPEDRLTTRDDVLACVTHVGALAPDPTVTTYVMGLDVGLTHDRTVVTVAHSTTIDGGPTRVVVDRQEVWAGTRSSPVSLAAVEDFVLEAHRAFGRAPLVFDPFQAVHLAQRLRASGVRTETFTFSAQSVGRLALTVYRLLRDRLIDLPDDDDLIDELSSVRLRETNPGCYRLDHDPDRHDDRVVSLALAAHRLVERPRPPMAAFSELNGLLAATSLSTTRRASLRQTDARVL